MRIAHFFIAMVSASAFGQAWALDSTLSRIRASHAVTLAYREAAPPFSYLANEANGKRVPVGYSMDLCLRLVEAIKKEVRMPQLEVRLLPVSSNDRLTAIVEGHADLECGSTTNTIERRKSVTFTIPHFFATTRMLVRQGSNIRTWTDLKDKRVVTTRGTTTVALLDARSQVRALGVRMLESADHQSAFDMLARQEADAFVMDDVLLYSLRAQSGTPSQYQITGDSLSAEPYAIMLRRDDPEFKSLIDREMARMMAEGEVARLYRKWFKSPIPPRGVVLDMDMGRFLRDTIQFPTDKVADTRTWEK